MSAFKFRLQSYLDLKKAEKKNLEFKLANILKEIYKHENQINIDREAIEYFLDKLNTSLLSGLQASQAQAVPESVKTKRINIGLHEGSIAKLNLQLDVVKKVLYQKEAEIKVIDEMKDKKFKEWKKKIEKKREDAREELIQIRKYYNERNQW